MCRLAAYLGSERSLEEFIISQPHSLYKQSWQPKEMREATLNADGFGFAWYENSLPKHYRNTLPIWNDVNLAQLASTLKSNLWLAYIRSATPGQAMGIDNTQPFTYKHLTFIHNGLIKNFSSIKRQFIENLSSDVLADIKGDTDSEYLFALFKQIYSDNESISKTFKKFSIELKKLCGSNIALVNIIVSDGTNIGALKYALNAEPPSLYFLLSEIKTEPNVLIASEPFDEQNWQVIKNNSILIINEQLSWQTFPLD